MKNSLLLRLANGVAFIFILCFSAFVFAQTSEPAYEHSEPASWVSPLPAFDTSAYLEKKDAQNIHYRLIDYQINAIDPTNVQFYYSREYELLSSSGVQDNSRIEITYDPAYEKIVLHDISLLRDGSVIDKLPSSNARILQQEEELESLIYNGTETLSVLLDDIRKGDIVRYSFTRIGSNPIFMENREFTITTQFRAALGRYYTRILSAENSPLHIRKFHSESEIQETTSDGIIEYVLDLAPPPTVEYEESTPNWRLETGRVVFSDIAEWDEVVSWAKPMYDRVSESSPEIKQLADELRLKFGEDSTEALIGAALQWVQEEVRYFGIELGANSHQPSPAAETIARRYGDCKDKTVLLISLLAELGIDSYPALVDSGKWLLAENDPSRLHAFDHVIVYAEYDGQGYWLDATDGYQQGKLGEFSEPDFGKALIIKSGESALTEMHEVETAGEMVIEKTISIDPLHEGSATMGLMTRRSLEVAEAIRANISRSGIDSVQENYENYYRSAFPSLISKKELEFEELDGNVNVVNELYHIDDFWQVDSSGDRYRWLYADDIYSALEAPEDAYVRSTPFQINHPKFITEKMLISLPWDVEDRVTTSDEKNEYFELSRKAQYFSDTNQVHLTISYKTLAAEVPVSGMKKYADAVDAAENLASHYLEEEGLVLIDRTVEEKTLTFLERYGLLWPIFVILGIVFSLLAWLFERKRLKTIPLGIFYPVSKIKFFILMLITFGLYIAYWFYKNFKYLKSEGEKVKPILRAIFTIIFYFSLYRFILKKLSGDENAVTGGTRVRLAFLAVVFAIVYSLIGTGDAYTWIPTIVGLLGSFACLYPMISRINSANEPSSAAYVHNSKWRIRHLVMVCVTSLFLLAMYGERSSFFPTNSLVSGGQLRDSQQQQISNMASLDEGEEIIYFFSSSQYDYRLDGNGFTEKTIFSYWQDDDGKIRVERKPKSELKEVASELAETPDSVSTVTLSFKDGEEFIWHGPTEEKDLKEFTRQLL